MWWHAMLFSQKAVNQAVIKIYCVVDQQVKARRHLQEVLKHILFQTAKKLESPPAMSCSQSSTFWFGYSGRTFITFQ